MVFSNSQLPELEKRLKSHTRRLTLIRTFSAAAAVALLCLSVWTAYLYMQPVTIQTVSTLAETRTVCLPDGSTVTLNHYSSLSYPEKFKLDKREVKLNGEAYFEVNKNKKHPFIVQTETIDVQVLGTHFNVDAYQNNPDVKTTLLTGSVAVSNKSKSVRVILKPNEIAIYNKVEEKLTRKVLENVEDEISWRQGEFIFDDLPLQEIARELSNSFGATIHIADTALQNYGSQHVSAMEKIWQLFYLYYIMPVISTTHKTRNRLLSLLNQTKMNIIFQDRFPIRTIVLIGVALLITTQIYAQNADARLSLTLRNATLKEFVKRIENSTGYSFIYGEEIIIKHKINLQVKDKPLREILDLVFKNEQISYQFTGRHILLQKKKESKTVGRKFTISGYVTDGTSSETLIGTNIIESHQNQGTTTNPYGFYSITLPEGETELRFSYLGYATEAHHFTLSQDTLLNIRMQGNTQLQEVVIVSDKTETGTVATQMGSIEIPMTQIKNTPSILGEADVMKAIQLMPGVQAGVDGSAGLYIRGGSPDQNLILLDGTPVYNVDHMFGFFSVFTPEAVKKVTLFKSSFPARFGGRLSSVIDVRTNDGDMQKYHGTLSIGLLTSKINLEGPIVKGKTSFNISARRSYVDLIAKPFMPNDEEYGYYFYDINAKINHKFSDRSRIYLSVYNGKDHFAANYDGDTDSKDGSTMNWGNTIVSARWNYIFNNRLFSNTTVSYNNYLFDVNSYNNNKYANSMGASIINRYSADYRSGINDWSYQIDFDYNPSPAHHIKFGTGYIYHRFRPEVMTSKISEKTGDKVDRDTTYHSIANSRIYGHELSAYLEDNIKVNDRLRLNLGLHFSLFQVQKQSYSSLQPRVSARYQLGKA